MLCEIFGLEVQQQLGGGGGGSVSDSRWSSLPVTLEQEAKSPHPPSGDRFVQVLWCEVQSQEQSAGKERFLASEGTFGNIYGATVVSSFEDLERGVP